MKACEFVLYKYMCANTRARLDIDLFEILCTGKNKARYSDGTFTVQARRMSGEMTTSLGNGWTNLCLAVLMTEDFDLRGVVEGDDGLFAIRADQRWKMNPKRYADYGFSLKLELFETIEEAQFCGIVYAHEAGFNLSDPVAELVNFGWTFERSSRRIRDLLVAKAYSLAYEYPGCPVMTALARMVFRLQGDSFDTEWIGSRLDQYHAYQFREMISELSSRERLKALLNVPVHPASRMAVERKFGLNVHLQFVTEKYLDGLSTIQELHMPWLEPLVHSDLKLMTERFKFYFPAGTTIDNMHSMTPWRSSRANLGQK